MHKILLNGAGYREDHCSLIVDLESTSGTEQENDGAECLQNRFASAGRFCEIAIRKNGAQGYPAEGKP
jgi:hypothetical protein